VCGRKKALAAQVHAMAAAGVTVAVVVEDAAGRRAVTEITKAKAMVVHVRPSHAMIL
jgi:hypothetical protein